MGHQCCLSSEEKHQQPGLDSTKLSIQYITQTLMLFPQPYIMHLAARQAWRQQDWRGMLGCFLALLPKPKENHHGILTCPSIM